MTVYGRSDVGSVRTNNEDALLIADATFAQPLAIGELESAALGGKQMLLAVSDGMGGENAGEVASALTLEAMLRTLPYALSQSFAVDALRASIDQANVEVSEAAHTPGREGMGATLVAALIHDDFVTIAGVGDSRAYLLRTPGTLARLTRDQSYVQAMIDRGEMTEEEAAFSPQKNVILQAIGRMPALQLPLSQLELRRGDILLLCSDGLTGEVEDGQLREILMSAPSVDVACERLIEVANAHGGRDNVTCVVAMFNGPGLALPTPDEAIEETLRTVAQES
ncbi:MAG: protein phosphatase 2C domain-containing protein [Polyangiaceae bacterium]